MDSWLKAALDYVPRWLDFQMQAFERPGCAVAIVQRGRLVFERAFGVADLVRGLPLTPRHRFRVASHSKSFAAAGILKLREQGRLSLDDPIGRHVAGLHPKIAAVTIQQILSHSAGIRRDMPDNGYFADRRPYPSAEEVRAELAAGAPAIEPNTRFKYSNVGYALLGLAIEGIAGEPYPAWMRREVIAAAGLAETAPDMPLPRGAAMARGHSGRLLLGRRVVVPGDQPTGAFAPVGGVVATAADLARFYDALSPTAKRSFLSVASRREMIRPQWRDGAAADTQYGLGIVTGRLGDWAWFGHSGGLQGFITRTMTVPAEGLTVSVLTNSIDGMAGAWVEGILHILRAYARHGAPARRVADWRGRWWSLWGATDLVPMGGKVFAVAPGFLNPFADCSEIAVTGRDTGRIVAAGGYGSYGEAASLERNAHGKVVAIRLAGGRALPAAQAAAEMVKRYETPKRRRPRR
ncbi:MAG: beta-lactamase family protein [Rhodospirillaceae bacterium]|nr:beta-lactamase family protein [Rhodospirillaceae bacterium]